MVFNSLFVMKRHVKQIFSLIRSSNKISKSSIAPLFEIAEIQKSTPTFLLRSVYLHLEYFRKHLQVE